MVDAHAGCELCFKTLQRDLVRLDGNAIPDGRNISEPTVSAREPGEVLTNRIREFGPPEIFRRNGGLHSNSHEIYAMGRGSQIALSKNSNCADLHGPRRTSSSRVF